MGDLWDSISKGIDVISKGNDAYIDIKNGTKASQTAEQALQYDKGSNPKNITSWTQPAVLVGIVGVAIAVIALIIKR
jgi:hypothetical protein